MTTTVKYRHIGMPQARVDSSHALRFNAIERADQINNKPFTPYYAWLEDENGPVPAHNPFTR